MRRGPALALVTLLSGALGCGAAPAEPARSPGGGPAPGPGAPGPGAAPAEPARPPDGGSPPGPGGAVVAAVLGLPELAELCRETEAQGARCVVYVSRAGAEACPAGRTAHDECAWEVYAGANMGSHVSRLATFYVDPATREILGVSDLGCPPMTLSGFRQARAAARAERPLDECPEEIPVPSPP